MILITVPTVVIPETLYRKT